MKGKISDGSSALPFVNIIILDTHTGTASKLDGTYEIIGIPLGRYEVKFSLIGYESKTIDVNIEADKTTELNVELEPIAIELQNVEVIDVKSQDQRDTRTSLIDLNPRDAKILAGAVEDVFRTLQSLPEYLHQMIFLLN
ncbi:MAG: carboxypeptidase-like regulatory domain-containing protein [Ignavibacteriaceae bacterium]|nr:carboxypeptidase-like regulatory domain-containing protein [Ignavibacteriaceae bacterium]